MGFLEYSRVEDFVQEVLDREGDIQLSHTSANYESIYGDLTHIVNQIPILFAEWIRTIRISEYSYHYPVEVVHSFKEIMNSEEDVFFTFNYTTTLETLYEAENVTHIHGSQDESGNLIVGHNNDKYDEEEPFQQDIYKNQMRDSLRKDVESCLEENEDFFDSLEGYDIDSIYSYGLSFGAVDDPYIKKIVESLDTKKMTWFFNSFSKEEDILEYQKKLRKFGFEGNFDEFDG